MPDSSKRGSSCHGQAAISTVLSESLIQGSNSLRSGEEAYKWEHSSKLMSTGQNRREQVTALMLTEPGWAALPTLPLLKTVGVFFPMLAPLNFLVQVQTPPEVPLKNGKSQAYSLHLYSSTCLLSCYFIYNLKCLIYWVSFYLYIKEFGITV